MFTLGGDFHAESSSRAGSSPATRSNRVKFMCSYGGRILPRPADGVLKYVGGDTRLVSVPRDITFLELMEKLSSIFNPEVILKYQITPEDLEVLVSVRSDEDTRHLICQCDVQEFLSAPYVRAFLFSTNPIVIYNQIQSMDHYSTFEQRYIYAINYINLHPTPTHTQPPLNTSYTTFTISSDHSSTSRTPPLQSTTITTTTTIPEVTVSHANLTRLPRRHSSPSLSNLGDDQYPVNHQQLPQLPQHHHFHPQQPPRPPLIPHLHGASGSENLGWVRSTGVGDHYHRQHTGHATSHNHRTNRGGHMGFRRSSRFQSGDSSSV